MSDSALLAEIRRSLARLTPAERRIAETILQTPHTAITWSIADAARIAKVSEPTVIRFCRRLECDGFPAFRLKLAQALAVLERDKTPARSASPKPETTIVDEVFAHARQAIDEARADLDIESLQRAARLLLAARRIDIYGYGGSGFVASEAQHRFAALGIASVSYADPTLQMVSAPLLTRRDAVFAISLSGRTSYLIANLELARKSGARLVAIAPSGSPVAELADVAIGVNAHRFTSRYSHVPFGRVSIQVVLEAVTALMASAAPSPRRQR
ncbi:MAG: MurR/RpiR family transcriptional regulator [Alphaproteobacteria bacterium]|nr:MurR/RpiR family transcriptional regulator [Alphaproteobacteria bacterium]